MTKLIVGLLFSGLIVFFYSLGHIIGQAERAPSSTKHWILDHDSWFGNTEVFDTKSVCIYVFKNFKGGGIAAIPKSQLNIGAGCQ